MSQITVLQEWSRARGALAAAMSTRAVGVVIDRHRTLSGIRWGVDLIVTAAEPVGGRDAAIVLTGEREHAAAVIASDPGTDVALLRLAPGAAVTSQTGGLPAAVGQPALAVGEGVIFAGRARRGALVSFGSVRLAGPAWSSRRGSTIDQRLEFEGDPDARFEGGLVADLAGGIRAMLVAGPRRALLGIPATTIERVVAAVERHGYLPRPYLGLRVQALWLNEVARTRWGRPSRSVPVVAAVETGSPADAAGIAPGDLLESIDGATVADIDAVLISLRQSAVGQRLTLGMRRGGLPQVVMVEVADWRARAARPLQSPVASP